MPNQKGLIHILVVLILLAGLGATLYLSQHTQIFKPRAQEIRTIPTDETTRLAVSIKEVERLNLEIIKGNSSTSTSERPGMDDQKPTTAARKEIMLELAKKDPEQFLRLTIPDEVKKDLPQDALLEVEKQEIKEGVLEVLHADDFVHNKSETFYILKTPAEKISLYSPEQFGDLKSNTRIKVKGIKLDDVMVVEKPEKDIDIIQKNAVSAQGGVIQDETHGQQKVAVILVNFQDDTSTPWTREYVKDLIFNKADSVNAYYKEVSYDQVSLTGDVFGWYTINSSSQYQLNRCDYSDLIRLFSDAIQASDPDINFRDFSRIVVAFPNLGSCYFGGWGDLGYTNFTTADGTIVASKAWINGEFSMTTGLVAHELGHNFGLHHARAYSCKPGIADGRCTREEYGDPFDLMGQSGFLGHFNAPHKAYLNWFSPSEIQTVTANGRFTINPIESGSSGIKLLKVPKEISANNIVNKWYYLEYRQPIGFDKALVQYNSEENIQRLQNGLVVHFEALRPERQLSYYTDLLDMTPNTQYFADSPIRIGENYLDSITEAGFTPVEKRDSAIMVDVRMPARKCIQSNPTIEILPKTNTGTTGQRLYYYLKITNNDNSFCTSPSTYRFEYSTSSNNPSANTAGWNYQLTSSNYQPVSSLTLSPVETKYLLFFATPPLTPDGYYDLGIKLINNADASFTDSDTVTYIVASSRPCSTPTPRPTIIPNAGEEPSPPPIITSPCPSPTPSASTIPTPNPSPSPNFPPTGSVSGPTHWPRGIPTTFTGSFQDINGNLLQGEVWLARTDSQPIGDNCPSGVIVNDVACRLGLNTFSGSSGILSTSYAFSLGTYFVFVQAYDSAGAKCSAAAANLGSDWSDCGDNDFLTLTVF